MRFNPFNPQQPARPEFFVGRESEIKEFQNFLGQTINNSPMNMAVTGNRGMGKTSLLIKLEQFAKENNCLVVRLSNYEGNVENIVELSEFIISNIKIELARKDLVSKLGTWLSELKPTISFKDVSLTIEKQVIQELLREKLIEIWDKIKGEYTAIVILIDEAESLEEIESSLPFLREVFQRVSLEAKYMIVLSGKLHFPERMSEYFSPLNRFFSVHRLKELDRKEIRKYVTGRLETVNIEINEEAINEIIKLTEGHPYVLVATCYLIFDCLTTEEETITKEIIDKCIYKIKGKLAQDFFKPMFHPLSPKAKKIILSVAKNTDNLSFGFKQVKRWTSMPSNELSPYLSEAIKKGIINKPERANYKFFHSLFLDYLKNCSNSFFY